MAAITTNRRLREFTILRLFFRLVLSFFFQYVQARLTARTYDFFEDSKRNRERAIKIREASLALGGVPVKVGQFLSSRVDLLPSEYIEELALLQDEVPGVPYQDIRHTVERELGGQISHLFSRFDATPLAAASLGQVHRACLPAGEEVAVKVQRPGIGRIVEADLGTFRYIVHWLSRHTSLGKRVDLPRVLVEFEETLRLELDYCAEGHHAERILVMFSDVPELAVPRIFWSHSARQVLTMQYMEGIKVTDFAGLERSSISRSRVAEIVMACYLRQVLHAGFFHADPHPGNILVRPGPVVVLLDFGMVGELPPQMRDLIRTVFLGVVRREYDTIIVALQHLGFFTTTADIRAIRRALIWTIDTFYGLSFGEMQSVDPRQVIDHLQEVLFSESFQIPANFAFLGRALGTLSGLCTALDPSFQFITVAEPFARDLMRREQGLAGILALVGRETRSVARAAYSLPFLTQRVLADVQTGELDLHSQFTGIVRSVDH
ncbi:MAG: ABC1 kinase family protein, partial [Chloroflexota bacterium]